MCPFCRTSRSTDDASKQITKRAEKNDTNALVYVAGKHYSEGKHKYAFDTFKKAAQLGDAVAHYLLSTMYMNGHGVKKDDNLATHHLEVAAIGGHPEARYILGKKSKKKNDHEKAVKHWSIAANHGHYASVEALLEAYKKKEVSKDDLESALRGCKAAIIAAQSAEREFSNRIVAKFRSS